MKAYMELKDILAKTVYGTRICLINFANDRVVAEFTMKVNGAKGLPREVVDAEPIDFSVNDNCLIIKICKDE